MPPRRRAKRPRSSSAAPSASRGERLQLLIAELRKSTEEAHHVPAQLLGQRSLEGRHPGEPHAAGDQEEELTVGAPLRFGLPEVWHRGVEPQREGRLLSTWDAVTDEAVRLVRLPPAVDARRVGWRRPSPRRPGASRG